MLTAQAISEVVARQLCSGCGVCAASLPRSVEMTDDIDQGRRPFEYARPGSSETGPSAACPGAQLTHAFDRSDRELNESLLADWGPVYEVWEGYAGDAEIRRAGSSGGAASALALFAIERGGMFAVLHMAAREDVPYVNETVFSRASESGFLPGSTGSKFRGSVPFMQRLLLQDDSPRSSRASYRADTRKESEH